jgi:hypothetical protein
LGSSDREQNKGKEGERKERATAMMTREQRVHVI